MKASSFHKPNPLLLLALGLEIKKRRKKLGFTIEEFSDICMLHSKYIQTIERGTRNISISVFVQISKGLGLSPEKLLARVVSCYGKGSKET